MLCTVRTRQEGPSSCSCAANWYLDARPPYVNCSACPANSNSSAGATGISGCNCKVNTNVPDFVDVSGAAFTHKTMQDAGGGYGMAQMGAVRLPEIRVLMIDDSLSAQAATRFCSSARTPATPPSPPATALARCRPVILFFVPGLPHVTLIELRLAPHFVPGLPHVTLVELRLALISYQDYHMLLLFFRRPSARWPSACWSPSSCSHCWTGRTLSTGGQFLPAEPCRTRAGD